MWHFLYQTIITRKQFETQQNYLLTYKPLSFFLKITSSYFKLELKDICLFSLSYSTMPNVRQRIGYRTCDWHGDWHMGTPANTTRMLTMVYGDLSI